MKKAKVKKISYCRCRSPHIFFLSDGKIDPCWTCSRELKPEMANIIIEAYRVGHYRGKKEFKEAFRDLLGFVEQ